MDVHQAQPPSGQAVLFYEIEYFIVRHALDGRELVEEREKYFPALQIATGKFANDHRMAGNLVLQQPFAQGVIAIAQMVDPYGSIDENHFTEFCAGEWVSVPARIR